MNQSFFSGVVLLLFQFIVPGLVTEGWAVTPAKTAAPARGEPHQVVFIPWGEGPGQVGKQDQPEMSPEGPPSFAVSPTGEIYVLDLFNDRILKFNPNGALVGRFPLPKTGDGGHESPAFDDILISPDGRMVLLDRLVTHCLAILDQGGKEIARHFLSDLGIAARRGHQSVGEMFFAPDGLYLEDLSAHRYTKVLDQQLKRGKGNRYPGKPFKEGQRFLEIFLDIDRDKKIGRINLKINGWHGATKEKVISVKNFYKINLFLADYRDNIYLVYSTERPDKKIGRHPVIVTGLKFDENSIETGRFQFHNADWYPLDCNVNCRLTPEGDIYFMDFTQKGVRILRWKP